MQSYGVKPYVAAIWIEKSFWPVGDAGAGAGAGAGVPVKHMSVAILDQVALVLNCSHSLRPRCACIHSVASNDIYRWDASSWLGINRPDGCRRQGW